MQKRKLMFVCLLFFLCGCGKKELEERYFSSVLLVTDKNLEQEIEEAQRQSSLFLDFGHTKAVIMDEGVLTDKNALKEILVYLEERPVFARNMLVFCADSQVLKEAKRQNMEIGPKLQGIYKNQPEKSMGEGVTLQDMLNYLHNQEKEREVPKLTVEKGKIFIQGNIMLHWEENEKETE